jgi:hypothetical protein
MESKWDIYNLIPKAYYPSTLFFEKCKGADEVMKVISLSQINFPLIAKPDIGMKGLGVQKLNDITELADYVSRTRVNFLIQEYIPYKNEIGIFYYRLPGDQHGHISGIVNKEFLSVTGDGISTIEMLLMKDKRYILQISILKKTYGKLLQDVLQAGKEFVLVPYGNHVRGAKFTDASHLADEKLTSMIDSLCSKVQGFHYGRLDVRYNTWEELREGKNFSIIELNGAGSEPTHMYDPGHSIFYAWKEIIRHWNILYKISRRNHHAVHRPYMDTRSGLSMLKESSRYLKIVNGNS